MEHQKNAQSRTVEHALTSLEAQDFQRSPTAAFAMFERAHGGNQDSSGRTVIMVAPGGRVLGYIRGRRATITVPITIPGTEPPPAPITVDDLEEDRRSRASDSDAGEADERGEASC